MRAGPPNLYDLYSKAVFGATADPALIDVLLGGDRVGDSDD